MFKVALGYDSHRFGADRPLVLGGVEIPGHPGLIGHSDADAVLHALTDAVLGAIGADDIGEIFSDADPRWQGADSSTFLARAVALAAEKGYHAVNADVTVLAEAPKLSAYKPRMRARIAELLGLAPQHVAVKAKTNEGMGAIGRGEGIAVLAIVMMREGKAMANDVMTNDE